MKQSLAVSTLAQMPQTSHHMHSLPGTVVNHQTTGTRFAHLLTNWQLGAFGAAHVSMSMNAPMKQTAVTPMPPVAIPKAVLIVNVTTVLLAMALPVQTMTNAHLVQITVAMMQPAQMLVVLLPANVTTASRVMA